MTHQPIYLDYAAATPLDPTVFTAMQPYFSEQFYNPSASYLAAKAVAADLRVAREQVAHVIGAKPTEIIFTAGGTEANNLAIQGIMARYPEARLCVSAIEHESVREPAAQYDVVEIAVGEDGLVDLAELTKTIDDQTVLVSLMYANNEIGTVQPLKEVAAQIRAVRDQRRVEGNKLPLYLHADACQAANYLDLHVGKLGVDLMTLNGGKIYGPKQSGVLYVKTGVDLAPLIRGGGQERSLRSGTENVAQAVGFAAALQAAQTMRHDESKRLTAVRDQTIQALQVAFPEVIINGSLKRRLPNNISLTLPGQDNERLMMALDERGIICAVGSACSASKDEPSHVLRAIGLSDEAAQATLRLTLGRGSNSEDMGKVVSQLQEIING